MAEYTPLGREVLGRYVRHRRKALGYSNMQKWSERVGRSTRYLQGFERGEQVGDETIATIAEALNDSLVFYYDVLQSPEKYADSAASEIASVHAQGEWQDAVSGTLYTALEKIGAVPGDPESEERALRELLSALTSQELLNELARRLNTASAPIAVSQDLPPEVEDRLAGLERATAPLLKAVEKLDKPTAASRRASFIDQAITPEQAARGGEDEASRGE